MQIHVHLHVHVCVCVCVSAEYNSAVARYTDKWERFQTTYQRMPKAQELSNKMEELNQIKAEGIYMHYVYDIHIHVHACVCINFICYALM